MTEQELEELDKRVASARRLASNIKQTERHMADLAEADVYSDATAKAIRGLNVIRDGAAIRIKSAILETSQQVLDELRKEFEAL